MGKSCNRKEDNPHFKGDNVGYNGKHYRLYRERGPARDYTCVKCDSPAKEWAQIHTEDGLDPWADYVPLCRGCHRRYDYVFHAHSEETRAKIVKNNLGRIPSAETRARLSAATKGMPKSAETRARMSAAMRKRWEDPDQREKFIRRLRKNNDSQD